MTTGDWLITALGSLTALAGVALLSWSLFADRLRTRRLRREGSLRRCPRCWYDMSATRGLTCPECGKTANRERALVRARRRWSHALAALLVLVLASATIAYPHGRNNAWRRWLPDTAVILLLPHTQPDNWAAAEISRRLGSGGVSPWISTPGRLHDWERSLLHRSAERAWLDHPSPASAQMAWWLLAMSGPITDQALDRVIVLIESNVRSDREAAFRLLERSRFHLTDAQLARALAAVEASPPQLGFGEQLRQSPIKMLSIQLESRADEPLAARLDRWEQVPLTPDALTAALDHKSMNELTALHSRFMLPQTMLIDTDESIADALVVERVDLHIDDDDLLDCVLLLHNRTWEHRASNIHYEALVLSQQTDGWRFLARIDLSNCLEGPPKFSNTQADDGTRWLIIRRDADSSNDGRYYVLQDAWLRARNGRFTLDQTVLHRGINTGMINQTLDSTEPRVVRRGGRYIAEYDITSSISLVPAARPGTQQPPEPTSLGEYHGTFAYPLGVPDTKLTQHVAPGPWGGEDPTWLLLGGPEVLVACRDSILNLAHTGNDETRAALIKVIDDFIGWAGPVDDLTSLRERVEAVQPQPSD